MGYAIGILVSFIIYMIIGSVLTKRIKNVEDYYVYGRNAPTFLIVGTLIASYLSTVAFMGEAGFSYSGYPIPMLTLFVFNTSGYVIGAILFGRYLRRSRSLTLPEYFGDRFDSKKVRVAAAVTTIVGISCYLVAVTQGGAILLSEILNINFGLALFIMWLVYTSFTFLSGSKGVIVTDAIMFLLFMLGTFVGVPYIIHKAGGWPDAITQTANLTDKPNILAFHGITGPNATMGTPVDVMLWALILGLVWGCVVAVSPWQSSRYLMAKNEHVVIRSGIISMIVALFFAIVLHVGITTLNVINPNLESDYAFIWATMNLMPYWMGILVLSGIFAAALSSCSTFLQLVGNSVSNDIIRIYSKTKLTNKQLLRISRISMLLVSIVILLITYWQLPSIMFMGYLAATLFAASWGPTAFASIYSKTVTKEGAFWSIIAGFLGVIVVEIIETYGVNLPVILDSAIVGAVLAIATLFIVSKFGTPTEKEIQYRLSLLESPEENFDAKEIIITKRFPLVMRVVGAVLIVFTFLYYYFPIIQ